MRANEYPLGSRVRCTGRFTVDGAAADPTTVTCQVKDPAGSISTYVSPDVVHDGLGVFHLDVTAGRAGDWRYRFVGAGAVVAAGENVFVVSPSEFD